VFEVQSKMTQETLSVGITRGTRGVDGGRGWDS
jgi:hypothetical protein